MNTAAIVSKVWSFCNVLRDDGVGYGDYLEQLTYLLFLKMADEYSKPPYNRKVGIPEEHNWETLRTKRGAELEAHYLTLLRELGQKRGMLGQIFSKSQNKIQDPAKLYSIIDMIDKESWVMMGADVKVVFKPFPKGTSAHLTLLRFYSTGFLHSLEAATTTSFGLVAGIKLLPCRS
jgi:type I restriction enzyme M protein